MKRSKILFFFVIICVCLLLQSCVVGLLAFRQHAYSKRSNKTEDYMLIYNIVDRKNKYDWVLCSQESNLLCYGEYKYNSFLLFCPRHAPATLTEFHYCWFPGLFDVDDYEINCVYKLEPEDFRSFVAALDSFYIEKDGEIRRLIADDTHFAYPAYIIQWLSPGGKWQTLEYFLIDEKENTVIFSYVMATGGFYELDEVVSYDILPNTDLNSVIDEKDKNGGTQYAEGFTVYFPDDMEGANYDLSFLEYLK